MKTSAATDSRLRRVIEAAGWCFSQTGVKATTMDEIAAAAGVSKPFLYKYFESKDLLTVAVIEEALETWLRLADEAASGKGKIRDRIASRMAVVATFSLERPVLRAILGEDRTLQVTHGSYFRRARESALEKTRALLRQGVRSGEFPDDLDVEASARVVEILTHGLAQSVFGLHTIERSDGMVGAAVEMLRAGLPKKKSSTRMKRVSK